MAKLIYACSRAGEELPFDSTFVRSVLDTITPDNLKPRPPYVCQHGGAIAAILNPSDRPYATNTSVAVGTFLAESSDWHNPGSKPIDGNYALTRSDGQRVEVVTDALATYSLWIAFTRSLFVVSSSQRAIVALLGSFQPNNDVIPWMLSTGTLGPGLAWDRRLKLLKGNRRVVLDRRSWRLSIGVDKSVPTPKKRGTGIATQDLRTAIDSACSQLPLDPDRSALALSGGYDSRALLMSLKHHDPVRAVTWGHPSALNDEKSDAAIARSLAKSAGVSHQYFALESEVETAEVTFDRFLAAGEGRVDHIAGYADGFRTWINIFNNGIQSLIRGDEAFGCKAVKNDREVFRNMSFMLLTDFAGSDELGTFREARAQFRPQALLRGDSESRELWRDRLNREFEIPIIFAALNDLKLSFTDIINPFLTREVLDVVGQLADEQRTDKAAFKSLVHQQNSDIPFARKRAIGFREHIVRQTSFATMIFERLSDFACDGGLPSRLSRLALTRLCRDGANRNGPSIPSVLSVFGKVTRSGYFRAERLDPFVLAFRALIVCSMHRMLRLESLSRPRKVA